MDIFAECMVKRKLAQNESLFRSFMWGLILFILFFFAVSGIFFNQFPFLILFLIASTLLILDKYYFHRLTVALSYTIEYEYTLVNSDLDFDKIVGKEERSRLLTVDLKTVELLSPVTLMQQHELDRDKYKTVADASRCSSDADTYAIICEHCSYGRTLVYFTPDENFLKVLEPCVRSKIRTRQ